MPRGYDDQPEYNRARDQIRRNDGRDVRRAVDPNDRRTTIDRDYPMDDAMDMRDPRPEPRAANTGTRVERPIRGIDPRGDREVLYRDPRTGEIYRDAPSRRTPYENEFEDIQPSSRPIVVSIADSREPRPSYAEYFLPGEGIEREVIQAEICKFLGQDATCRPGKNPQDGRSGFIIKAYRALTTEMIRSLQESSLKFRNEEKYWADKDKHRRRPDVLYTPIQDIPYDRPVDMDIDDDDRPYIPSDRFGRDVNPRDPRDPRDLRDPRDPRDIRDIRDPRDGRDPRDLRDPRAPVAGRHPAVTTGYIPEPGYPAYAISSGQSSVPQMGFEPRSFVAPGNTTPPAAALRTAAFPPAEFPPRTTQQTANPSLPAQSYLDPRTGKMVTSSYSSFSTDRGHRR